MRRDSGAVAGFFEDLSVMIFVLAGVSMLVGTYAWSSELVRTDSLADELDHLAERYLSGVMLSIRESTGGIAVPSLEMLRSANLSECAAEVLQCNGYASSIQVLHPYSETVTSASSNSSAEPSVTGYASELTNALDARGLVVVLEVRCIVW